MLIVKYFWRLHQVINKFQNIAKTAGLKNAIIITLKRYLLRPSIGEKAIHYPYYLNFQKINSPTIPTKKVSQELSQANILYITQDPKSINTEFFQSLKALSKSLRLKKNSIFVEYSTITRL